MQRQQLGPGSRRGRQSAQSSLNESLAGNTAMQPTWSAAATNEPLTITTHSYDAVAAASMPPPSSDASVAARLQYLHHQLNSLGADAVVLGSFKVLDEHDRRQGGTSMHPCGHHARTMHAQHPVHGPTGNRRHGYAASQVCRLRFQLVVIIMHHAKSERGRVLGVAWRRACGASKR